VKVCMCESVQVCMCESVQEGECFCGSFIFTRRALRGGGTRLV